ncbi:MAG: DUF2975 domain-containing protein [Clostridia bacterium]|nr:DUF2975 domain-containing protein [Clostridia bacterium]
MAEERLADDDKDKKYRIRINEDGEEELEIIEPESEDEEQEEYLDFWSDIDEEQEDPNVTEELMRAAREEQERLARAEARDFIEKAKERIAEGDAEYALVALDSAQEAWDEEYDIYTLKLELLTNNFTDFSRTDECLSLYDGYTKFVPEDEREKFRGKYAANIAAELEVQQKAVEAERAENEEKKAERRVKFKANRDKSLRNFLFAAIPFIVVLFVAIGMSSVMFSDSGGVLLVVTIVLFAMAAVGLIATIILLRPLVRDASRLSRNEKNTSTAIGRAYIESSKKAEALQELYDMIMFTAPAGEENTNSADAAATGEAE